MATLTVYNPFDRSVIDTLPLTEMDAASARLSEAHALHEAHPQGLPKAERLAILTRFKALMMKHKDELISLSLREGGKPYQDTVIEADRAIDSVQIAIDTLRTLAGTQIPMNINAASSGRMAYTFHTPIGVVLAISAFNHPINLIMHQAIPAVATGCPVLVKPATTTPLTCFKLVELLHRAGLPKEWCQTFVCDNDVANALVKDARISFLSFIGSGKVGWHLRSQLPAGAHCALEHGGAAPVVLAPDANLNNALPKLIKGGFYHAGQVCVSVQRIFVHRSQSKTLCDGLVQLASNLKVGDPADTTTEVGPLILPREVERVDAWVSEAIQGGAQCLTGGKTLSETLYAPTVLLNPPANCTLSKSEIFGPVVTVYEYDDIEEAFARANSLPFCFQASIFSNQLETCLDATQKLTAKTVLVNDHSAFRVDWMPFGGLKESGLGVGGIPYSMHDMLYEKQVIINAKALS